MKKIIIVLVGLICVGIITGVAINHNCNQYVNYYEIGDVSSKTYRFKDIDDAIAFVSRPFENYGNGCILQKVSYIGDEAVAKLQSYFEKYDVEDESFDDYQLYNKDENEIIALRLDYNKALFKGDGSVASGKTYKDHVIMLVRKKNRNWQYVPFTIEEELLEKCGFNSKL